MENEKLEKAQLERWHSYDDNWNREMGQTIAQMLEDWENTQSYMDKDILETVEHDLGTLECLTDYIEKHWEKFKEDFIIC